MPGFVRPQKGWLQEEAKAAAERIEARKSDDERRRDNVRETRERLGEKLKERQVAERKMMQDRCSYRLGPFTTDKMVRQLLARDLSPYEVNNPDEVVGTLEYKKRLSDPDGTYWGEDVVHYHTGSEECELDECDLYGYHFHRDGEVYFSGDEFKELRDYAKRKEDETKPKWIAVDQPGTLAVNTTGVIQASKIGTSPLNPIGVDSSGRMLFQTSDGKVGPMSDVTYSKDAGGLVTLSGGVHIQMENVTQQINEISNRYSSLRQSSSEGGYIAGPGFM